MQYGPFVIKPPPALKPCPHCGGTPKMWKGRRYWAQCGCLHRASIPRAVWAWNSRLHEKQLNQVIQERNQLWILLTSIPKETLAKHNIHIHNIGEEP